MRGAEGGRGLHTDRPTILEMGLGRPESPESTPDSPLVADEPHDERLQSTARSSKSHSESSYRKAGSEHQVPSGHLVPLRDRSPRVHLTRSGLALPHSARFYLSSGDLGILDFVKTSATSARDPNGGGWGRSSAFDGACNSLCLPSCRGQFELGRVRLSEVRLSPNS